MTEIWAYQATNVIEITGNLTAKYWPNQLIKITQGTEKFFVIMGVGLVGGNTRLTVSGGGVYILTSDAITAHHMTTNAAPVGLPSGFAAQADSYAAVSKDTPIDDDRLSIWDSAANFVRKGLTWANLKATLKTYFDGLYAVTGHNHSGTYAPAANGVTNGDSHDHSGGDGAELSQYVALAGRAGGQTIEGDTASEGSLTLSSTHHATKGNVIIQPSGGSVGIGTSNPVGHVSSRKALILSDTTNDALIEVWGSADAKAIMQAVNGNVFIGSLKGGGDVYLTTPNDGGTGDQVAKFSRTTLLATFYGGIYVTGNCSALSFTDRTDAFAGDALAAIAKIAADAEGNIDHSTLPEFAQAVYTDAEGKEQAGRDIGNMVSVLTTGMQQLIAENFTLKERLKKIEERIEA